MTAVSIKEIARIARVSHSTVSRALRNQSRISRETAERVRKVAADLGYHPSLAARSLVTQRTQTVGCVVTNIADPFMGGIVSGIEEVANQRGYSVFLQNSNGDPKREMSLLRHFREHRIDGVLIAASRMGSRYVPQLKELKIPIVLINNQQPGMLVNSVAIDNMEAMAMVINHLLSIGHRDIAYIGDENDNHSNRERGNAYRQLLQAAGIVVREEWIRQADGTPAGGEAQMQHLLNLPARPTAVCCYDDLTALGVFKAIRQAGLEIPNDISVTGFDDLFLASYMYPALTTIHQPLDVMGRRAMSILLELLSKPPNETRSESWHVKVRGELIVRESTNRLCVRKDELYATP